MRKLWWLVIVAVLFSSLCVMGCKRGPKAGEGPASPAKPTAKTE
jgi:hypothetical protein